MVTVDTKWLMKIDLQPNPLYTALAPHVFDMQLKTESRKLTSRVQEWYTLRRKD